MIFCKELNKEFESDKDMFNALKENKEQIISFKKAQIQKSCDKGISVNSKMLDVTKLSDTNKDLFSDDNYYYVAVNTTNILDSHSDLHKAGIWNKTVNEQQGKNYLVLDHSMEISKVVVKKENIQMFLAEVPFSMLGKSYQGNTQALIYKFPKDKVINESAKEWLSSGDDIEASVRMQYVKIDLAIDSNDKEDVEYKKVYDENINLIANKEDFEEIKYFWVVTEAKNVGESSLVLFGSNSATGQIKDLEPSNDTLNKKDTQDEPSKELINIINNFKF